MPKKVAKQNDIIDVKEEADVQVQAHDAKAPAKGKKAQAKKADAPAQDAKAQADKPADAPAKGKKAQAKKADAPADKPADAEVETEAESDAVRASRQAPTRESVEKEFDELIASVDEEIEKLRDQTAKSKGVKFLRTLNKRLKALKTHSLRVSKQRTATRRNNTNSGFLKPVQISKDLAKFTGWNPADLRSRVDVTKFICNYIREKNLQDPNDRRRIRIEDDQNLKKLLKFEESADKPLTYYSLQTYLKGHFTPVEDAKDAKAQAQASTGVK